MVEVVAEDVVVIDRARVRMGSVYVRSAERVYHTGLACPAILNPVLSAVHG